MALGYSSTRIAGVSLLHAAGETRCWRMFHDWYAVSVLFEGAARLHYRSHTLVGQSRMVNVFEPGEVHFNSSVPTPCTFAVAFVPANVFLEACQELGYHGMPHFRIEYDPASPALFAAMTDFLRSAADEPDGAEATFSNFVATLLESSADAKWRGQWHRTRALDAIVEAARSGGACPATRELAALERISERQLHRSFKSSVGVSPVELYQLVRVARVIDSAAQAESLADLASSLGFSDQSHMNRVFRRVSGCSVGGFARAVRGGANAHALDTVDESLSALRRMLHAAARR